MTDTEKLDLLLSKVDNFATKDDIRTEINMVLEELDSTEQRINRKLDATNKKIRDLYERIDSVRYSNEAVEILMKRQDNLENRVQEVERKISFA